MFLICVTLDFKWRHYISTYNSLIDLKHNLPIVIAIKTLAIEASLRTIFMHIYHADMLPLIILIHAKTTSL